MFAADLTLESEICCIAICTRSGGKLISFPSIIFFASVATVTGFSFFTPLDGELFVFAVDFDCAMNH